MCMILLYSSYYLHTFNIFLFHKWLQSLKLFFSNQSTVDRKVTFWGFEGNYIICSNAILYWSRIMLNWLVCAWHILIKKIWIIFKWIICVYMYLNEPIHIEVRLSLMVWFMLHLYFLNRMGPFTSSLCCNEIVFLL